MPLERYVFRSTFRSRADPITRSWAMREVPAVHTAITASYNAVDAHSYSNIAAATLLWRGCCAERRMCKRKRWKNGSGFHKLSCLDFGPPPKSYGRWRVQIHCRSTACRIHALCVGRAIANTKPLSTFSAGIRRPSLSNNAFFFTRGILAIIVFQPTCAKGTYACSGRHWLLP